MKRCNFSELKLFFPEPAPMCGQMADGDNCPLLLWISHLYPIQKHIYKDMSVDIDGAQNRGHAFLRLPIMSLNVSIFFLCKWSTALDLLLSPLQWLCNYQTSKNLAAGPLWREHWLQYLHQLIKERAPCAKMDVSLAFFLNRCVCVCVFGVYVERMKIRERECVWKEGQEEERGSQGGWRHTHKT